MPTGPGEATLRFVDDAVDATTARLPEVDPVAMRLVMLLHRVTNVVVYDLESTVHRPGGWSWASFRLLFTLWVTGPVESKRVAELAGMSRPAVSSVSKTLVSQGLLRREDNPHDRRGVVLALTAHGAEQLEAVFLAHNEREREWARVLSRQEQRTLVGLLSKLADAAQEDWVSHRS